MDLRCVRILTNINNFENGKTRGKMAWLNKRGEPAFFTARALPPGFTPGIASRF
jgi:hypothetical protein